MRRALRGRGHEADQFDRFVATNADPLLRTAYLLAWDMAEAEDLVQECLLRVARRWPRVRTMEHPAAYARQILVNLSLDGAKGRARRRQELAVHPTGPEHPDHSADRALGNVDANQGLRDALHRLPRRQRAAIVLRYFEDMSEAQTAAALGCSVGTVKSTTSKALDRLRATLGRDEIDPTDHDSGPAARWPAPERSTTP